jgi:hypothetical protein
MAGNKIYRLRSPAERTPGVSDLAGRWELTMATPRSDRPGCFRVFLRSIRD